MGHEEAYEAFVREATRLEICPKCCVCKREPGTLVNDDGSRICEGCAQAMNDMRPD